MNTRPTFVEENTKLRKELVELRKDNQELRKILHEVNSSKLFQVWKVISFLDFRARFHLFTHQLKQIYAVYKSGFMMSSWYFHAYDDVTARTRKSIWWHLRDSMFSPLGKVARMITHPMWHYLRYGPEEGRDPNPFFSSTKYWQQNPDVKALRANPLAHYLMYGRYEGRQFPVSAFFTEYQKTIKRLQIKPYALKDLESSFFEERQVGETTPKVAVHLHLYNVDLLHYFADIFKNIPFPYDLFISTPALEEKQRIVDVFQERLSLAKHIIVKVVPNRGRNFAPLIIEFGHELIEYDIMLHVHSKRSSHNPRYHNWLDHILSHLCGTPNIVRHVIDLLLKDGVVVYPEAFPLVAEDANTWKADKDIAERFLKKISTIRADDFQAIEFPVGGMFWARPKSLAALLTAPLTYKDFPKEPIPTDGTLAHAIERTILLVAKEKSDGYCYKVFGEEGKYSKVLTLPFHKTIDSNLSYAWDDDSAPSDVVGPWDIVFPQIPKTTKEEWKKRIQKLSSKPVISIVIPAPHTVAAHYIHDAIRSIQEQGYTEWQLCLAVTKETRWAIEALKHSFGIHAAQLKVIHLESVGVHTQTFQACLPSVEGTYVIWLSPYDVLHPETLLTVAEQIQKHPGTDLFYSDEEGNNEWIYQGTEGGNKKDFVVSTQSSLEFAWGQVLAFRTETIKKHQMFAHQTTFAYIQDFQRYMKDLRVEKMHASLYIKRHVPHAHFLLLGHSLKVKNTLALSLVTIPLRICFDARLINRKITGTERYMIELLRSFSALRKTHPIHIFALVHQKPKERIEGVTWVENDHEKTIQHADIFHKTFPASDTYNLKQMAVAHACVFTPLDLINYSYPEYFAHETDYAYSRVMMQCASAVADTLIAISQVGKIDLINKLGIAANKICMIHLGIRLEKFLNRTTQENAKIRHEYNLPQKYFFCIGTNYPHKNLVTLYRALKFVVKKYPDYYLVRVGANYYPFSQPEVEEAQEDIRSHLIDLKHVPDEHIPSLYQNTLALVYPTLYEGFGFPVLEAMACKTAVISSDATSIPEIAGKENALLVDTTSSEKLAEAMIRLIEEKGLRARLIARGTKWVQQFSWEKTGLETLQSYEDTVQKAIQSSNPYVIHTKLKTLEERAITVPCIFIVTHVRFYPPTAGNELRIFRLIQYFKKQGFRVVVLMNPFLEKETGDKKHLFAMHEWVDHYEELSVDETVSSPSKRAHVEQVLEPLQHLEQAYCPDAMLQRASELMVLYKPKVVIAEYIWTSRIFQHVDRQTLKVIDLHDMFSRKKDQVLQHQIEDAMSITPEQEKAFINRADVVMAIQDDEAEAFRKLLPKCKVVTTTVDFDVIDHISREKVEDSTTPVILIVASNNLLNQTSIKAFLSDVWPSIHKKVPHATLRIVGKVVQSLEDFKREKSIEFIPYVQDIDATYAEATIVVNPVYAGTGLKIKSVEAIGHHKALVAYSEGVAGLKQDDQLSPFVCVENKQEMASTIVKLLTDKKLRKDLEKKAVQYAQMYFSQHYVYKELSAEISKHIWPAQKPRVLCLFLRFGTQRYPTALKTLQDWYAEYLPHCVHDIWIIDNQLEQPFDGVDIESGLRLLSGDNVQREFSAWQKIVQEHKEEIAQYDVVHFVTAAFNNLYVDYLKKFHSQHLVQVAQLPLCVGHLDCYDEPIQVEGVTSQDWIRTCFFFMSPASLYKLPSLVSFARAEAFIDAEGKFKEETKISKNYQENITKWLTGGAMQGVAWHRELDTKKEFGTKSLTIINEHSLSIQMRQSGVMLVDIGWWKEVKKSMFLEVSEVPAEIEQIKQRNRKLGL